MKLARIDQAIEKCKELLAQPGATGTEVEAFLTNYLLILTYATFEEEVKKIIVRRAAKVNDRPLESFVNSSLKFVFRSMLTSELAKLLACFGSSYREKFRSRVNGTKAETFFNNIITNRNRVAHEGYSNVTFREMLEFYQEGHIVLDALSEVVSES
jgi:hypothetical protein